MGSFILHALLEFSNKPESKQDLRTRGNSTTLTQYCFTRKYTFVYNEIEKKLEATDISRRNGEKNTYVDMFDLHDLSETICGDITYTAVVGNNGAGKTKLMKRLHRLLNGHNTEKNAFLVVEINKEAKLYGDIDSELVTGLYIIGRGYMTFKEINKIEKLRSKITCIYQTQCFSPGDFINAPSGRNYLSTGSLLRNTMIHQYEEVFPSSAGLVRYHHEEVKKMLAFVKYYNSEIERKKEQDSVSAFGKILKQYNYGIPFNLVKFDVKREMRKFYDKHFKTLNLSDEELTKRIERICGKSPALEDENYFRIEYQRQLSSSILVALLSDDLSRGLYREFENTYRILEEKYPVFDEPYKGIDAFLGEMKTKAKSSGDEKRLIALHKCLKGLRDLVMDSVDSQNQSVNRPYAQGTFLDENGEIRFTTLNSVYSYLNQIEQTETDRIIIYLEWGMSSGEMALLSGFSRLYDAAQNRKEKSGNEKKDHVLLMLDEADLMLHPRWQREYVMLLNEILPMIYPDSSVHTMIATHSPIMLSDIPEQHTMYLLREDSAPDSQQEERSETFGANIYTLYNRSFFLESQCTGAFAENVIKSLIRLIDDYEAIQNKNNQRAQQNQSVRDIDGLIEKYLRFIGDDYIRSFLTRKYQEKRLLYGSSSYREVDPSNYGKLVESLQRENAELNAKIRELKENQNKLRVKENGFTNE